jgi:hypothetical protein
LTVLDRRGPIERVASSVAYSWAHLPIWTDPNDREDVEILVPFDIPVITDTTEVNSDLTFGKD